MITVLMQGFWEDVFIAQILYLAWLSPHYLHRRITFLSGQ